MCTLAWRRRKFAAGEIPISPAEVLSSNRYLIVLAQMDDAVRLAAVWSSQGRTRMLVVSASTVFLRRWHNFSGTLRDERVWPHGVMRDAGRVSNRVRKVHGNRYSLGPAFMLRQKYGRGFLADDNGRAAEPECPA